MPTNDVKQPDGEKHPDVDRGDPGEKAPQDSTYHYYGYDRYYAVKGPVTGDGYMLWYATQPLITTIVSLPTIRGAFWNEYVWATGPVACIYFQVTWHKVTGSVSVPAAATVNSESVSDGMYRSCRKSGYDRPFYFTLGDANANKIDYASRALTGATLTVCYSTSSSGVRYCSSVKHYD